MHLYMRGIDEHPLPTLEVFHWLNRRAPDKEAYIPLSGPVEAH